jgi:pentatricopeptide repeat protein
MLTGMRINQYCYTALIRGCGEARRPSLALALYQQARTSPECVLDRPLYQTSIWACATHQPSAEQVGLQGFGLRFRFRF